MERLTGGKPLHDLALGDSTPPRVAADTGTMAPKFALPAIPVDDRQQAQPAY